MASKVPRKRPRLSPRAIAVGHCHAGTTPCGLERRYIDDYIGYGLFTSTAWSKGDFLIQYQGILLTEEEALQKNEATYQYYFTFKGKRMCIDATDDTQCLAKYANDEKKGNAYVKLLEVDDLPCLCIFARRNISPDEEIRYNYGVKSLPWRYTEDEEHPHQLVEQWVDVKHCCVCQSPLKSQKWKGLLCIVCQHAWHEECYVTIEKSSRSSCSVDHSTTENANDKGESFKMDDATEIEERDDTTQAENRGDAKKVGERDVATEAKYRGDATEVEGRDDAIEAEDRGDATEVEGRDDATEAENRGDATEIEERDDTTQAENRGDAKKVAERDIATEEEDRVDATEVEGTDDATEAEERGDNTEVEEMGDNTGVKNRGDTKELEANDAVMSDPILVMANIQNMKNMKSFQPIVLLRKIPAVDKEVEDSLASHDASIEIGTRNEGESSKFDDATELEERDDTKEVKERDDATEVEGRVDPTDVEENDDATEIGVGGSTKEKEDKGEAKEFGERDNAKEAEDRCDVTEIEDRGDATEVEGRDDNTGIKNRGDTKDSEASANEEEFVSTFSPFSIGEAADIDITEIVNQLENLPLSSPGEDFPDQELMPTTEEYDGHDYGDDWPPLPTPSQLDLTAYQATSWEIEDDYWPPPPPPPPQDVSTAIYEEDVDDNWPPLPPPFQLDLNQNDRNMDHRDNDDGKDDDDGDEYDFAPSPASTSQSTFAARNEADSDECSTSTFKTSYPQVTLPVYSTNNGSRSYDKLQCCFVCSKLMKTKMARHLNTHADTEVAVADAINEQHKERRAQKLEALRLMGNFNHNVEILKKGVGQLIVVRRSHHAKVAEDYLPCLKCYGFFEISELWRHVSQCKIFNRPVVIGEASEMDVDEAKDTTLTSKCRMLLSGALHGKNSLFVSHDFKQLRIEVINAMRADDIKRVVEGDELVLMFGTSLLERLGSMRKHVISQRMRQLARLLIAFKGEYREMTLMSLIDPSLFDDVVGCVRSICGDSTAQKTIAGVKMFDSPSYGLHIGHTLVKCCMLKRGRAIRLKDQGMKEEAVSFQELLEGQDWTSKVSSPALQSLKERRFSSVDELPSTSDLRKLNTWTARKFHEAQQKLRETPNEFMWRQLCQATFVLATIFNKRRSGEVGRMTLDAYTKRPQWQNLRNEEMENALSSMELKIADRFDMVQLPGKRGRRVPLLLKPEWVTAMDLLVKLREECDVKSKFFFGVPGKSSSINSWKVIRDMAVESGCEKPELISTTRMRKYTATVLQLLSLEEGELEWVSNHLGHNIDIHRLSYRLHESTIECTKIAKLLMAIESGTISKYSGCTLDDLDVNDIDITLENGDDSPSESEESDGPSEAVPELPQRKLRKGKNVKYGKGKHRRPWVEESDEEDSVNTVPELPQRKLRKEKNVKYGKGKRRRPWVEESDDEDNVNKDIQKVPQRKQLKKQSVKSSRRITCRRPWVEESDEEDMYSANNERATRTKGKRARWSAEEIKILRTCFSKEFRNNNLPSFAKINRVMEKYPMLKQRNPASIKSRFQYMLKQKCKM